MLNVIMSGNVLPCLPAKDAAICGDICQSIWTGAVGSILAAIIIAVLVNFVFERANVSTVVRVFRVFPFSFGRELHGKWIFKWNVDKSRNYPRENYWEIELIQYLRSVCGVVKNGDEIYYIRGNISSNNLLTGYWKSPDTFGYHGVFQGIIATNGKKIKGKWAGFSSKGHVNAGDLVFERK